MRAAVRVMIMFRVLDRSPILLELVTIVFEYLASLDIIICNNTQCQICRFDFNFVNMYYIYMTRVQPRHDPLVAGQASPVPI